MEIGHELNLSRPVEQLSEMERLRLSMTKRKLDVLYELKKNKRLSQGELARKIGIKPTALANILLKLDDYSPKLLNKEYEGKYCYYALSELGYRFVEENQKNDLGRVKESSALLDKEDEALFWAAQKSLDEFKGQYGDEWQVFFDDVLVHYTRGTKQTPDKQPKLLANQYLRSLELLTMHQNDKLRNETLALLKGSVSLSRVTEFIDTYFDPFSIVLRTLQQGGQTLQISVALKSIFAERKDKKATEYINDIGWNSDLLHELEEAVSKIKICIAGYTLEDIFDYVTALLPDQEILCSSISQWLLEFSTVEAEKVREY